MGLRKTTASVDYFPPTVEQLVVAFNNVEKKGLSVGARAVSKHYHRSKNLWWGSVQGNYAKQNQHALTILEKLLNTCIWINAHAIPHDIPVFEIRNIEGYGARWMFYRGSKDKHDGNDNGIEFRGFLEPPDPEGHVKGWKH